MMKVLSGLPNNNMDFPFQDIMMRCWDFIICFLYFTELLKVFYFFTSYIWSAFWPFHRVKALESESCISFGGKSSFSYCDWSCQTPRHVKLHLGNHKCCWWRSDSKTIKGISVNFQESLPHSLTKQLLHSYHMPDPLLGERLMNVNEKPYLKTHSLGGVLVKITGTMSDVL